MLKIKDTFIVFPYSDRQFRPAHLLIFYNKGHVDLYPFQAKSYFQTSLKIYFFFLLFFASFCVSFVRAEGPASCLDVAPLDGGSASDYLVLDVPVALTRALNYNRPLVNAFDAKIRAEYAVILSRGEFDIQINPESSAGYVGGSRGGAGVSVGGGLSLAKKFETGTFVTVGPNVLKTPEHYQTNLKAVISQPLLRGFGTDAQLSQVRGAQFNFRTACRNLFIARIGLAMQTVQALYEVVKASKTMEFNGESHSRIEKFFRAAKMKEKIGLSDGLDVYRAEIELRQSEESLSAVSERLQETKDLLRDMLALPLDIPFRVEVPLVYTPNTMEESEAVGLAFENRIEMDQAEDQWREHYRLSSVAKNNLYPDLNLVLDFANSGRHEVFSRSCTGRRESKWGIGFTTSGEYDPAGDRIAYEDSRRIIYASERNIEQTKANLTLEVKKSLRHLQRSCKRIALQEEQIKTSRAQLYLAQLKFERGMANNFDVIQAEKTFSASQIAYWSAIIEHIVGEYHFLAAIGLLTDKPVIK